ncbi:MAG: spore germination protein [Intestinibacillus sp.]
MQDQALQSDIVSFSPDLEENISTLQALFQGDNTFITRRVESRDAPHLRCAVFFFDGMVDNQAINESIIRPITEWKSGAPVAAEVLAHRISQINDSRVEPDPSKMFSSFLYGDTVIFTEGDPRPVVVNTKGFALRSTAEPDNERVLQGPREGFTEGFMSNLSRIRRRLRNPHLKFSFLVLGSQTHTTVCLCYLEGVCKESVIKEWKSRLSGYALDGVLDANYLSECIRDSCYSPFPTIGVTERPDVVVARLLEGQVALVVDGTPVVLTAPYILQQCFQANDDYYRNFFYVGLARILRFAGFVLSNCIPAMYVALLLYHQEVLPTRLLFAIAAARQGVPMPTLLETVLVLLIFEVLKEAGTRTPGAFGQTMSIVGGLVLGQAAVSARFVSAPVVIVVAIAGVLGLLTPKLTTAAMVSRFFLLACGAVLGLYGVFFGTALLLAHLSGLTSFGVPYLLNLLPRVSPHLEDAYIRMPWFRMQHSGRFVARKEGKP